ncbi:MAG: ABC transporter ATP-binding protein, partial [Myxococcota bacterium]
MIARWMARGWGPRPGWLAFLLGWSAVSAALNVGFPLLWQRAIDEIGTGAAPTRIATLGGWMAVTGLAHAAVYFVLQGARAVINARLTRDARVALLDAITAAQPDAARRWRPGDVVARAHDDAGEKSSWFLCSGIFRAYEAVLVSGGALIAIAALEPSLVGWLLLPLPVLIAAQAAGQSSLSTRNQRVQTAVSAVSDQLATTFGAIRTVKAAGLGPHVRRAFVSAARDQRDAEVASAIVMQGIGLLYQYGWQLAVAGLLLFGGLAVLDGEMTLGRYVALEGLVGIMVWPMFDFGILVSRLPQAAVALRRLDELL